MYVKTSAQEQNNNYIYICGHENKLLSKNDYSAFVNLLKIHKCIQIYKDFQV